MKSRVLDRPMFRSGSRPDIDNIGIMHGFMEPGSSEDMDETPDDFQSSQNDEDMEASHMVDRRPDSPEILMNNLRGDMRSVDARYKELADLFGPAVARDTPEEVLALLQPVLAGSKEGIGALPGAQALPGMMPAPAPAPPGGMPPPPPPPPPRGMPPPPGAAAQGPQGALGPFPSAPNAGGAPGQGPAPVNMAGGGDVWMVANAGRFGDSRLAYLSPAARQMLVDHGGSGTINPLTGLHEYAWWDTIGKLGYGGIRDAAGAIGGGLKSAGEYVGGGLRSAGEYVGAQAKKGVDAIYNSPLGGTLAKIENKVEDVTSRLPVMPVSPDPVQTVMRAAAPVGKFMFQNPKTAAGAAITGGAGTAAYLGYGRPRPDTAVASPNPAGPNPAGPNNAVPVDNAGSNNAVPVDNAVPNSAFPPAVVSAAAGATDTNDFLSRTNKRFGELKQALTSPEDKDWMQAQALFLLADAALKIPSAGGRTPLETISRAGAGIPAGFAALGAQQAGKETKIRAAAAGQVLGEQSEERKYRQQMEIANVRALTTMIKDNRPLAEIEAVVRASNPDFTPAQVTNMARGLRSNLFIFGTDENGNPTITNKTNSQVFKPAAAAPNPDEIGFIDPKHPNTQLTRSLSKATPKEIPDLLKEKAELQSYSNRLDDLVGGNMFQVFGPMATLQRVTGTNILLPLFGPDAPWAKLDNAAKLNQLKMFQKEFQRAEAAGGGRIAVAEQRELSAMLEDPSKFLSSPELAFSTLNRVRINTINRIAEINNRVDPANYPPVRINPNAPTGLTPETALDVTNINSLRMLNDFAQRAPGYQPYITSGPGRKPERITAKLPLPAFMAQDEIQKRLNPKQGAQ